MSSLQLKLEQAALLDNLFFPLLLLIVLFVKFVQLSDVKIVIVTVIFEYTCDD